MQIIFFRSVRQPPDRAGRPIDADHRRFDDRARPTALSGQCERPAGAGVAARAKTTIRMERLVRDHPPERRSRIAPRASSPAAKEMGVT
jgi:hypothetical protein